MAAIQNFRSALNGFNREDVVKYIELMNNQHTSQVNQLNTEVQTLRSELDELRAQPAPESTLEDALAESQARVAELEQELLDLRAQLEQALQAASRPQTDEELEAYRRAERAERIANDRVTQLYHQANGVLADATVRVDNTATQISDMVDQVTLQLTQLQAAVLAGRSSLKDAAAAMYAIHPIDIKE